MTLSPSAPEQQGPSDVAASSRQPQGSDAVIALRNARQPAELAAWLDHYAASSSIITASSSYAQNHTQGAYTTANATSKLDDISVALRQLSLSVSSVRDASRMELDHITTSLVSTISKIGIELKLMSETATTLQSRLHDLQTQTSSKDAETDAALARIAALSKAKAGLIDARHALREAQAWSTLDGHVTMLLTEQRWQEAVDRVTKAADSLRLFSGSAKSNHERSALLETLTQDIQRQLVPALQQAIAARDADQVAHIAKLLAKTQNGDSTFFHVYTQSRSQALLSRWAEIAAETSDKPLPSQLTSLFGDLLALLGEERVASFSLFSDPNRATQLLTADILFRLDPPIHVCVQQATRAPDLENFLVALTDGYKATEEALRAVHSILPEARTSQQKPDDDADASSSPIDTNLLALQTTDKSWLRLMIEPFIPYQTRLATFEAEAMQTRLHSLQAPTSSASISVSTASTQALQVVKAALRRSTALTKSFATPSLLPILDSMFETVMERARAELDSEMHSVLDNLQGRIRRLHLSDGARQAALTYDERGEVLAASDWDEFRKATENLAACKDAVAALRGLEVSIAYQISELDAVAKRPSSPIAEQATVDFTSPTSALATSSLNSAALHEHIAKAKRFLSTLSWNSGSNELLLLPVAHASILSIVSRVQAFQHDLVLSQFLPELELYPTLAIWTSNKHPSIVNEYDLAMPKFSLSPTEAMARVGEAMLNLPRLFEGYADEVLLFCLRTDKGEGLTNAADREERAMSHVRHATMVPGDAASGRVTMHRQAFSTTTVPTPLPTAGDAAVAVAGEEGESDAGVLSQYLRSLLTLFFKRFLSSVLPSMPRLTEIGVAQLAADLDYLSNISSVIFSESEQILRFWKKAAEINAETGRLLVSEYVVGVKGDARQGERKDDLQGWQEDQVNALVRSDAFRTVARLRGWI
ncbi:uncharacterized protein MEPE_05426 [Melanopsichium pennsylvanicum]|uniref:Conserved oligomeric Golgi complex subunit 7 n=2 Tax=Melanopsichium pennsylvanicum TaxID=63383 RepID=A0AAJ5C7A5_9BASI|nr:conserved hypothetical protein [Melanopsichium pennsylvanicum 4]SNX86717.1 uncharacterized protein MEPE_05426 [Melanopsichium pennsylvanicum]